MPYLFTALKIAATGGGRRRDHRRGCRAASRTASAGRSSTSTSSTSPAPRSCGRRSSSPRCWGSAFYLLVRARRACVALRGRATWSGRTSDSEGDVAGSPPPVVGSPASTRSSRGDRRPCHGAQGIDLKIARGRVRLADRPVGLRQVDAAAHRRRPRRADGRHGRGQRQAGRAGPPRPRLRDGLPGAGPVRLADGRGQRRAAARDHGLRQARAGPRGPREMLELVELADFVEPLSRGSCRAACSSASRSPGRSPSSPRSC